MKSYGGQFYDFMKELKFRSGERVFYGLKHPLGSEPNWQYLSSEHFKYLYYKEQMALWRKNVRNVKVIKEKLRGKMT